MKKFLTINLTGLLAATMFLVVLPTNTYASEYSTEQTQTIEKSEIGPQAEESRRWQTV